MFSCQPKTSEENTTTETNTAKVPDSWITERVNILRSNLQKAEGRKIVWEAMEVHGDSKPVNNNLIMKKDSQ